RHPRRSQRPPRQLSPAQKIPLRVPPRLLCKPDPRRQQRREIQHDHGEIERMHPLNLAGVSTPAPLKPLASIPLPTLTPSSGRQTILSPPLRRVSIFSWQKLPPCPSSSSAPTSTAPRCATPNPRSASPLPAHPSSTMPAPS